MELIVQVCVSGLLLGGIYALISIGLNLIFGVVRIINFAHGEMVMVAMYLTFYLNYFFGMDPYVSTLIVLPVMFLFGVVIQRIIVQPIQNSSANMKIFATVALSLILQNVALIVCSGNFRTVQVSYGMGTMELGGIFISIPRLVAFFAALLSVSLLYFFSRTPTPARPSGPSWRTTPSPA